MKMVLIMYSMSIDEEVMESLKDVGVKEYTKWVGVHGKGTASGAHLDSDIWPGANNVLGIALENDKVSEVLSKIRELRKKLGKEGVKGFIIPLEEIT